METLVQTQERLVAFIQEYCAQPSVNLLVDLSPGSVLNELLIKLSAALHQQLQTTIAASTPVASVKAALDATADTYSEAIEQVASNYNVTRDLGSQVIGTVKLQVEASRVYYLGNSFQLVHPGSGAVYTTSKSYRVDPSATEDLPNDGILRLYKEGSRWYFLLPVQSVDTASSVSVPHNSALVLNDANTTLPGYVDGSARAFGNFSGGRAKETDRQLISRFQSGLSARGLLSPQSMQSVLPEVFPSLFTQSSDRKAVLSVVGATDPELNRGRNTVFGITQFGLADVYVRTAKSIRVETFNVTAKYQLYTPPVGEAYNTWVIVLDETVSGFPTWFYDVVGIKYADSSGTVQTTAAATVEFSAPSRTANSLSGGNVITEADAARFSKYQVCTITTSLPNATTSPPVAGTTLHEVQLTVSYMPGIGEIQDFFLQSAQRILTADYLVKAVIPCSLSVNLLLDRGNVSTPDATTKQQIREAICSYINGLPFGEEVAISRLIDICHNFNIRRVDLPVTLNGTILVPTAGKTHKYVPLSSTDVLTIPHSPVHQNYGVSAKTTMFFIDYNDTEGRDTISISIN